MNRQPFSVLIVEDDPAHAEAVRRALASTRDCCQLMLATTLAEGRRAIAEKTPDLVVADLNLADGKAFDLLSGNAEALPYPLLVMTSHGDEQLAVQALQSGALDYVVKSPRTFAEMPQLVDRVLRRWQDIQERRRAEAALREREASLRSIIENAPNVAIQGYDLDGQVLFWNHASRRLFGWSEQEAIGKTLDQLLLTPEEAAQFRLGLQKIASSGQPIGPLECELRHRDGHRVHCLSTEFEIGPIQGRRAFICMDVDITDRVRAQTALGESQRRLADIIDFLPDATFAIDAEGRVLAWNRAVEKMTGTAKEAIIGRGNHVYGVPFYGEARPALVDLVLDQDLDTERLYDFVRREGDRLVAETFDPYLYGGKGAYLWATASPLYDSRGKVVGAIESVREITERKRAEQEILRAYGESRAITQAVRDILYMVDLHGRLLWWNQHAEEVTGLPAEALRERHYLGFFVDADVPRVHAAMETVLATGYAEVEARMNTASGVRPYQYHGVRVHNEAGEVVGIAGVGRDISEQVRSQEKLRLSATVLESTREGVMVTDADGKLIAVNHAFTEITGFSETEALGQHPRMLHSGRQQRDFYRAMWASIAETGHWQGEIWDRRKDGEVYPAWLTISAVRDGEGKAVQYVGVFSDITSIKQSEARLEHLAHYDPLTGLPNRLLLTSRLHHAIDQARRHHHRVAVLFLDLDHFKRVNDSLGHPVGDDLLQAIARRLQTRIREEDTLARLGGDEFVVVLEALKRPDEAATVAQSIVELIERPFELPGGHEIYLGVSIGISLHPDNGRDAIELIRNADTAMYQAKAHGRNTFRFYTEALTLAASERLSLESKLRRALDRGEFRLHYQPQVSIPGGRIIGMEALLRWQHPDQGLVFPLRFIAIAEETGLIQPIGKWVLDSACAQLRAWLDAGLPLITMAVNLSTRQLAQPDLVQQVRTALARARLPAACLELEITESAIMERGERAIGTLGALKELGITLSIDDFGTGYSSLAYLKQLPIDKLKVAKGFVDGIPGDHSDAAITTTIIAMARNLGLRVLAEGVETEAQRRFLGEPGCDAFQGYLFSRPLTAEDAAVLLLQQRNTGTAETEASGCP